MSAAISTALSPARRPVVARRTVAVLLALLVGVAVLPVAPPPAFAGTPTSTRLYKPASRTINSGQVTTTLSRLVRGEGRPMAGRKVALFGKRPGGRWRYLGSDTTSRHGTVAVRVRLRKTHYLRFRFAGSRVYAGSYSRSGLVRVRPLGTAAVAEASRHRGKPYGYGAAGPRRFDCSGFTSYVYGRLGKSLPHSSSAQRSRTRRIARSARRLGDLVFFHGGGGVGHVGIYAGNGYMWDSPRPGKRVAKRRIYSSNVSYGRVSSA